MFTYRNCALAIAAIAVTALPLIAGAKKPGHTPGKPGTNDGVGPDLVGERITLKYKCKDTSCTVQNFTLYVENAGDTRAKNSRIEYYLSDDTTLTTFSEDEATTPTDKILHRHSLGNLHAGRTKKKTVGGGLLKQRKAQTGQYIIALLDADNTTSETDEANNIVVSDPLP